MHSRVTRATGVGALVGVLSLVAACGGGGSAAPTSPSRTTPAATPSNSAEPAPATPAPVPLRAGERFKTLTLARPYRPAAPHGGTDDYRCFLVDPKLTSPGFLVGSQFLPQNAGIVHHAILFRVPVGEVPAAKRLDAGQSGDGWTCFSGTGIGGPEAQLRTAGSAPWLAAWAPGVGENLTPSGTGVRVEAGTRIVLQIHYNLLATNGASTGTDQSSVRLRFAPASADLKPLLTSLNVAPVELPCPAGEAGMLCDRQLSIIDTMRRFGAQAGQVVAGLSLLCNRDGVPKPGNTQFCDRTVSQPMVIRAAAGHMHLLGRSIKVEINPGTSTARTVLNVPVYDFDNQGAQLLPKPVSLDRGDVIRVTCAHDATLRTRLPELKPLKPRYVVWGEGTSDEMCLGVLLWTKS